MPVMNHAASVASGLRALTCFSLPRFRKRKNLTTLTIIRVLPISRHCPCWGWGKTTCRFKGDRIFRQEGIVLCRSLEGF